MVSIGYRKLFCDRKNLDLLLNLRLSGYTFDTLSLVFGCDKRAVRFQCEKYLIFPQYPLFSVKSIVNAVSPKTLPPTYRIIDGERINIGKSYAEYCSPRKPVSDEV